MLGRVQHALIRRCLCSLCLVAHGALVPWRAGGFAIIVKTSYGSPCGRRHVARRTQDGSWLVGVRVEQDDWRVSVESSCLSKAQFEGQGGREVGNR